MVKHRMNGHDGICATCGEIVLPGVAVQHFGVEVLTATPQQRIEWLLARRRADVVVPPQRSVFEVERELHQYGIDTSFRSCQPTPVLDVLAVMSRAVDRAIIKALTPHPTPRRRKAWEKRVIAILAGRDKRSGE